MGVSKEEAGWVALELLKDVVEIPDCGPCAGQGVVDVPEVQVGEPASRPF